MLQSPPKTKLSIALLLLRGSRSWLELFTDRTYVIEHPFLFLSYIVKSWDRILRVLTFQNRIWFYFQKSICCTIICITNKNTISILEIYFTGPSVSLLLIQVSKTLMTMHCCFISYGSTFLYLLFVLCGGLLVKHC